MITGTVVLDIRSEKADSRVLIGLYGIPDGAHVVLNVGSRQPCETRTLRHLAEHADRLHYDVYGDASAVKAWVDALRRDGAVW